MLRRTHFRSKYQIPPRLRDREPGPVIARQEPRGCYSGGTSGQPVEKECALQHAGYMDVVRAMPCARCRAPPRSDFAHADMDKGIGIKTDCRRGFPACRPCHTLLGSSGKIPRAERRDLEAQYGAQTRDEVLRLGLWPKRLPRWEANEPLR